MLDSAQKMLNLRWYIEICCNSIVRNIWTHIHKDEQYFIKGVKYQVILDKEQSASDDGWQMQIVTKSSKQAGTNNNLDKTIVVHLTGVK